MEMRAALQCLLKDDGILVIPTVADRPPKLNSRKNLPVEFYDRLYSLLSIATMSGGCQVTIPIGRHDDSPISVSFIASYGTDKFFLDTVLDMYSPLQEVGAISSSLQLPYAIGNMDAAELLKEKLMVICLKKPPSYLDVEKLEKEFILTSAEHLLSLGNMKWSFTGKIVKHMVFVDFFTR